MPSLLDFVWTATDNDGMEVLGRVCNGVVILENGTTLPEGAAVRVVCPATPKILVSPIRKRVQLPLVKSDRPGSVALTNERIAEILEAEDIHALREKGNAPS